MPYCVKIIVFDMVFFFFYETALCESNSKKTLKFLKI